MCLPVKGMVNMGWQLVPWHPPSLFLVPSALVPAGRGTRHNHQASQRRGWPCCPEHEQVSAQSCWASHEAAQVLHLSSGEAGAGEPCWKQPSARAGEALEVLTELCQSRQGPAGLRQQCLAARQVRCVYLCAGSGYTLTSSERGAGRLLSTSVPLVWGPVDLWWLS